MRRIRLFFVWVFMAAIPFQGFAAASMLFCHGAAAAHAESSASTHPHTVQAQGGGHHGHGAQGRHAVADDTRGLAPTEPAKTLSLGERQPDAGHKCSVCASCSHAAAVGATATPMLCAMAPAAGGFEPAVQMHSRVSPVPDKPPRG